tara:strand:- start:531 stop:758 length:228 start_codon:yes stop_codon:yes gene_type:complete
MLRKIFHDPAWIVNPPSEGHPENPHQTSHRPANPSRLRRKIFDFKTLFCRLRHYETVEKRWNEKLRGILIEGEAR